MLADLLLAGIVAAPLSSAALFIRPRKQRKTAGKWPAVRRLILALGGTAVLALIAAGVVGAVVHAPHATVIGTGAVLAVVSLAWLPATRRWHARGHLCWAASVFLFAAYLAFVLQWTFVSNLGTASTVGGVLLWLFEVFAALLACAYLWELCQTLGTEHWRRRVTAARQAELPECEDSEMPFVSLHVPAHNEPPDMVIETLQALLRIDYPSYEVVVIDDNTDDEALWRPVADWCAARQVKFAHLEDWPGYKSGALNYALRRLTDPRAEVVGVVDSDYQIDAGFLRYCAPLFRDEGVGFIQAPQDYRDWEQDPYYRRLYYSYLYFFAVSQPSRNERDGAIFAGTMGLIRRRALEETGGWDEWCITEDAELSLRLLKAGWSGLHVDRSWGQGVMPLTFEALKSQRYRWCFGGIQIMRMHWRSLLPGPRKRSNRLTPGQRWSYLAGGIQWYGDLLSLVFYLFLLAGAANLAAGGGQLFRKLTPFLVAVVPVLVGLGLIRAIALLQRSTGASRRDAVGAFFIWQSTALVVARASVQGLFARRAAFLRTPKTTTESAWWQPFAANWAETLLALAGAAAIGASLTRTDTISGPLLAGLLFFPVLGLAAAPFNSMAARRAALSPELRQRRQTEWMRERRSMLRGAAASGTAVALAAVSAVVALLMAPSPHMAQPHWWSPRPATPSPGPARPGDGTHAPATAPSTRSPATSPTGSPTPSVSPTTSVPATTPSSPTPSVSPTSVPAMAPSSPALSSSAASGLSTASPT